MKTYELYTDTYNKIIQANSMQEALSNHSIDSCDKVGRIEEVEWRDKSLDETSKPILVALDEGCIIATANSIASKYTIDPHPFKGDFNRIQNAIMEALRCVNFRATRVDQLISLVDHYTLMGPTACKNLHDALVRLTVNNTTR